MHVPRSLYRFTMKKVLHYVFDLKIHKHHPSLSEPVDTFMVTVNRPVIIEYNNK